MVEVFVKQMQDEFEMIMVRGLSYFLRFQIKQFNEGIFISQSKYAKNLVKKFGLQSACGKRTSAPTHVIMSKDSNGTNVDESLYRSIIGSLLYLIASRPDIAFSVGVCARYQSCPKNGHLLSVKRIIKYINGTNDYGLLYTIDTNNALIG
ncbi:uncharacterized mitochondrial protein AtMg00810-like [Benincasa hispida]|uniref:uncharacterized mitochondrial protein AtMg00810-like n=1 Tax=Benincasa hispida TaxID=102211 RepID=UPI001900B793|nr:uncharacterized mitochondrial protein AtMg00810-like [Benincasa hispida]